MASIIQLFNLVRVLHTPLLAHVDHLKKQQFLRFPSNFLAFYPSTSSPAYLSPSARHTYGISLWSSQFRHADTRASERTLIICLEGKKKRKNNKQKKACEFGNRREIEEGEGLFMRDDDDDGDRVPSPCNRIE